jgi:hypothetical protein
MASFFDMISGGVGAGLEDFLSEKQRQQIQQQSMMAMAAQLLAAGGPSTTPTSLGQAIGQSVLKGQEAGRTGVTNAAQNMLIKQKMDEYKRGVTTNQTIQNILSGNTQAAGQMRSPTPTPDQITLGSRPQSSTMPGQPMGMQQQMAGNPAQALNPNQQQIARLTQAGNAIMGLDPTKGSQFIAAAKSLQDMGSQGPARDLTSFEIANLGLPVGTLAQRTAGNEIKVIRAPDLAPNDIRLLQSVGMQPTWDNLLKLKQSGASSTKVVMPSGQTSGREAVDKAYAADYLQWVQGGGADATGNIAQVGTVLKQLEQGKQLTGPMIGIQPDFILALTNPNAADAKERVAEVVQRNLRVVLGPQFTAKEGESLISRAYNPALTPQQNAARLRRLYGQMNIAAQSRQQMAEYFEENGTLTGYKGPRVNINQFYEALEVKAPPKAGDIVKFNGQELRFLGGDPNQESSWEVQQ